MTNREILRRLRRLGKAITKQITSPNYGGCAIIAGHAAKALDGLGIKAEVVTPVGRGMPAAAVRHNVRDARDCDEWESNGLARQHLAVRFKLAGRCYTWDSDGLRRSACWMGGSHYTTSGRFGDGLTWKEALLMASRKKAWNSDFNRQQIPAVRTLVEYHLRMGL